MVKAIYTSSEIAFLVEWDDATNRQGRCVQGFGVNAISNKDTGIFEKTVLCDG